MSRFTLNLKNMQMKNLFLLVLLVASTVLAQAQAPKLPVDKSSKKVAYQDDVTVSSAVMKPALFNRANAFGTSKKLTGKTVRRDLGIYEATGEFEVEYPAAVAGKTDKGKVTFTLKVTCEDGKYQYVITDLVHSGPDAQKNGGPLEGAKPKCAMHQMSQGGWNKVKQDTDNEIKKLVKELKAAMAGGK